MAPAIVLIGAVLSVIIDQVIKYHVVLYLKPVADVEVIPGLFNLTYLENRGAAFGVLANQRWIFYCYDGSCNGCAIVPPLSL